ncbi:bacillithiol biosynthesis deacetylase BshB1 [Bacillus spongiae]|uniref:Bacillithiol biosynthesis deacetylase BshB1 n=1 Tax=Bacillus spongiae TaxID=2683610 RepID=A0ABU8HDD6_9BACI
MNKVDILAIGAHADDVEIGMGGTLAKMAAKGKNIVICDLTQADLSSNGSIALRKDEANRAGNILGINRRVTLDLPDRGLYMNEVNIQKIVDVIRKFKPQLVFAPYSIDRHPDHGNASKLIREAVFSSGIHKYKSKESLEAHRPKALYYYMINGFHKPDFMVTIDDYMETKIRSLEAYQSQFTKGDKGIETPLTNGYIEVIQARERLFGKEVNAVYAEGFKTETPIVLERDFLGEEE